MSINYFPTLANVNGMDFEISKLILKYLIVEHMTGVRVPVMHF